MIKFRCPACQGKVGVPEELAGRTVKCPKCGKPAPVPDPQGSGDAPGSSDPLLAELDRIEQSSASADGPQLAPLEPMPQRRSGGPDGKQLAIFAGLGGAITLIVVVAVVVMSQPPSTPKDRAPAKAVASQPQTNAPLPVPTVPKPTDPLPVDNPTLPDGDPPAVDPPTTDPTTDPTDPPKPVDPNPPTTDLPATDPPEDNGDTPKPDEPAPPAAERWFADTYGQRFDAAIASEAMDDNLALAEAFNTLLTNQRMPIGRAVVINKHLFELLHTSRKHYAPAAAAMEQVGDLRPSERPVALGRIIEVANTWLTDESPAAAGLDYNDLLELYVRQGDAWMTELNPQAAVEAYQAAYNAGKKFKGAPFVEIIKRREKAKAAVERMEEVERLTAAFQANPDDIDTARRLAEIYLFEFDRPNRAKPFVERLDDPLLSGKLLLLLGRFDDLNKTQLLSLAQWYRKQGDGADAANPVAMLIRAKAYFERYLALHLVQDAQRLDVITSKKKIDRQLARLGVGMKKARRLVRKVRGEAGALTDPRIDRAIAKGVQWLYDNRDPQEHWEGNIKAGNRNHGGRTALACYALTMAGQSPQTNADLRAAAGWVFEQKLTGTYAVCFRAHLWETLPADRRLDRVMHTDCRRMIRAQYKNGTHGYSFERQTKSGDVSTTLAAYLTFWLGEIGGIESARDMHWARVSYVMAKRQSDDGGWGYRKEREPTLQMTAAVMTILLMAVDQDHFTGDYEQVLPQVEKAIDNGFEYLAEHYNAAGGGKWPYYTLAAVQHVGLMAERKHIGERDWYRAAAEKMVTDQQADGSWGGDLIKTSFAVVFLARGGMEYDVVPPKNASAQDEPADGDDKKPVIEVEDDDVDVGPGENGGG